MIGTIIGCIIANILTMCIMAGVVYALYKKFKPQITETVDEVKTKIDNGVDKVKDIIEGAQTGLSSIEETVAKVTTEIKGVTDNLNAKFESVEGNIEAVVSALSEIKAKLDTIPTIPSATGENK